jgi:hypothetical protein
MRYGVVMNDKWTFAVEVVCCKSAAVLTVLGAAMLPHTTNGDIVECTSICDLTFK